MQAGTASAAYIHFKHFGKKEKKINIYQATFWTTDFNRTGGKLVT